MNISNYIEQKDKFAFQKIGNALVAVKRKWDPESGAETNPELQAVNLEEVKKQRDDLKKALDAVEAFITDAEKLLKA